MITIKRRDPITGVFTKSQKSQDCDRPKPVRAASQARPTRELVGTALKSRIEKLVTIKTGGKTCGCENLATQMDAWGIAGCEQRRAEIVGHLVGNRDILVESLGGWSGFLAGIMPDSVLRAGAEWLLTQAIEDVRATLKPIPHVRAHSHGTIPPVVRNPLAAITPRPFTEKPRLTLICHCWPNGESWRRHVEYLHPVSSVFDRKIMGVATGPRAAMLAEVQAAFGDSWEYFEVSNDKNLREVLTYRTMFEMVQSTGENDVTFCIHTKGTQAQTAESQQIKWWIEAMYATVVHNWQNVLEKLEQGYPIAGSFLRLGNHLQVRYGWHFSGTFYAFRNSEAFKNGMPGIHSRWYGTESWPGHHFARHEAACMFAEGCQDLYKQNEKLEHELINWKEQHDAM